MCSSSMHSLSPESTTWAASVPIDLAHAITAAVGVQPVPRKAKPAAERRESLQLLSCVHNSTPRECCHCCSSANLSDSPSNSTTQQAVGSFSSSTEPQLPLPIRRPTLAEIRAASPTENDTTGLGDASSLTRCSSGCSDAPVCTQALEEVQQPLHKQQLLRQMQGSQQTPAMFDDMDDVQQGLRDCMQQLHSSSEQMEQQCLDISSSASWHSCISKQQSHEQQQLLCQLWSQLQLPVQAEEEQLQQQQQQQQKQQQQQQQHGRDSLLLEISVERSAGSSSVHAHLAEWQAVGSSARSSLDYTSSSSSSSSSAAVEELDTPSSSCSYCCSTASSSCSDSRREKRVSWGSVTEYYLPPEQSWSDSWVHGRRGAVVAVAALGVLAAVAGAAAYAHARRNSST